MWDIDSAKMMYEELCVNSLFPDDYPTPDLSESDTRAKCIDRVLTDIMGWPENQISREDHVQESGTFIDYTLRTTHPYLIVEAKAAKVEFKLPVDTGKRVYKIGGVLSEEKNLIKAMIQARDYAVQSGVTFCCVTNGRAWIWFRAQNSEGIPWTEHRAVIFRSPSDIGASFNAFCDFAAYTRVTGGKLHASLPVGTDSNEAVFPFQNLPVENSLRVGTRTRNSLFPFLRDIITRVFQDLASEDTESDILEYCYVDAPRASGFKRNRDELLNTDTYLDIETEKLEVSKKSAGDFQDRIVSALNTNVPKEVILLIGSVGVGKTTFIQRFRKVLARQEIDEKGVWLYLNFKGFSDTGQTLDQWVYGQINETLGKDYADLQIDSWEMIKQAFHAERERLKRGVMKPLYESNPNQFETVFAEKIQKSEDEDPISYISKILGTASKRLNRRIFLVFDNADQLGAETQNSVFLLAEKLTNAIDCYSVISLREESYWRNRDAGPLNAFHSIAYHIQAPRLEQVVSKRFSYAVQLIEGQTVESDRYSSEQLAGVMKALVQTLLGDDARFIRCIENLSSRSVRRALDLIARFLYSGHTNVDSLLTAANKGKALTIGFHEFLTSIILADHWVYTESTSDVINLFEVDGLADASHFNRVTVLGRLMQFRHHKSEVGLGYLPISTVVEDCEGVGISQETTSAILSLLNEKGLVETETKIRDDLSSGSFIRVGPAGEYYLTTLAHEFTYLDLMIPDANISDKDSAAFKTLTKISGEIEQLKKSDGATRFRRLEKRLERVDVYLSYLERQFKTSLFREEKQTFDESSRNIILNVKRSFKIQREDALASAKEVFNIR